MALSIEVSQPPQLQRHSLFRGGRSSKKASFMKRNDYKECQGHFQQKSDYKTRLRCHNYSKVLEGCFPQPRSCCYYHQLGHTKFNFPKHVNQKTQGGNQQKILGNYREQSMCIFSISTTKVETRLYVIVVKISFRNHDIFAFFDSGET